MLPTLNKKIVTSSAFRLSAISLAISASVFHMDVTQAATIRVNSNLDSANTNSAVCMLRDAIESVNEAELQGGCVIESGTGTFGTGDQIVFDPNLSGNTILVGSQLTTYQPVSINASLLNERLTIDGGGQTRIFTLGADTVLDSLILTNGFNENDGGSIRLSISEGDEVIVNNSIITGNRSEDDGGGIGFLSRNGGSLLIDNSEITNNQARYGGGIDCFKCVASIEIRDSVISGNSARSGGGISFSDTVPDDVGGLLISRSTFTGNRATGQPSGVSYGAAINTNRVRVSINSSSIFDNRSEGTATDSFVSGSIGAINILNATSFLMENSTVSGNSSNDRASALRVAILRDASAQIRNSTFFNNTSKQTEAAVTLDGSGTTSVTNSIIGRSNGFDCNTRIIDLTVDQNTIIEDGSCNATRTGNPLLVPLANNGGSTLTHAPQFNSRALTTGNPATCTGFDQIGTDRFDNPAEPDQVDRRCDVGALESPDQIQIPETFFVLPTSNGKTVIFSL